MTTQQHLAIVGTTASGKSALALELARRHTDIELVAIDSMQVYRGMDIGTAKPTVAERAEVPHHLIDLVDPCEEFTVRDFQLAFAAALAGIEARRHRALLVGGTGLYVRAVVDDLTIPGTFPDARHALDTEPTEILHARLQALDPVGASRMTTSNRRRIVRALEVTIGSGRPFSSFGPGLETYPATPFRLTGVSLPSDVVARRIADRYEAQLAAGFLDEVRALVAAPAGWSRTASQALGYKELAAHLRGECDLADAVENAVRRTRQFARRQRAWFRRDPRIEWLAGQCDPGEILPSLEQIVSGAAP